MPEPRVIKRYANRKLYDTQHSRYVTLEQISAMIRAGEDVKIVDNKSKEDLTSVTLAQIIFEEEKKRSFMPLGAMRTIIQNGGEWIAEAQSKVRSMLPGKRQATDGAAEPVEIGPDAHPLERPSVSDDYPADPGDAPDVDPGPAEARRREPLVALKVWVDQSRTALDEWQRKLDGRIRTAFEALPPFSGLQKDVRQLAERLAELEAKLAQMPADDGADLAASPPRDKR